MYRRRSWDRKDFSTAKKTTDMQTSPEGAAVCGKRRLMYERRKKKQEQSEQEKEALKETAATKLSPTWAQECIEDIDDWIESQGIYLRQ